MVRLWYQILPDTIESVTLYLSTLQNFRSDGGIELTRDADRKVKRVAGKVQRNVWQKNAQDVRVEARIPLRKESKNVNHSSPKSACAKYVLRTPPSLYIYPAKHEVGTRLGDLVPTVDAPAQTQTQVYFTTKHLFGPVNCFACWEAPHDQPLILLYHLPEQWGYSARTTYGVRFWTEPLFGDCKEAGFRLSQSQLDDDDRLSRLFLAAGAHWAQPMSG